MLAALTLAAALAAAPPGAPPRAAFHLDEVGVGARLEIVAEPAAPSPTLAWKADGVAREGVAADARLRATVRVAPHGPGTFELVFTVEWRVAATVDREAVRLTLPGTGRAVARDLAFAHVGRALRVDRGTPLLAAVGAVAVAPGAGFVAARYVPVRDAAGRDAVEIDLLLDDAGAHPFAVYPSCLARLPGQADGKPVDFGALERKRFLGRARRAAGERVEARALLHLLGAGASPLPLVAERWPAGARAAVVFTDHADRTDPEALRAVLYGSSAPSPPPGAGFLGHGVRLTKSFFVRARRGGLADDPAAAALADALRAAGSEVASHSPTPDPDPRDVVRAALPVLQRFGVVTWIDHEPYTNCEAISSEGWRTDGRYGIRDLLAGAGLRWLWEAGDVGGFRRAEVVDLFSAPPESSPATPIYPLPLDPRLWVFGSTMFYAPPAEMGAAISDAALDRLEARRGLFVAHTYLSASERTTPSPEHRARLAVREGPRHELVLDPALDAALGRIARHVGEGRLATLTWAEAGDRLRALGDVVVTYQPDGAARVENRGAAAVRGLTLAAPAEVGLTVEGAPVAGRSEERGRVRVWLDLAPGAGAYVRASRGGVPIPFLALRRGATLRE